ncbi:MAG: ABC transporter permease [Actinobacteria bacterium]|nr:MAG: ABC transporter permease [Actinomycetota bacterium]
MRRRRSAVTGKRALTGWAVLVYLFLYVPILLVVVFAFNKSRDVTLWKGFTTSWFGKAIHDPAYLPAIKTSFKIATVNSIVATILGTMAALALARMRRATLVVPVIVIAVASLIFFSQAHEHVSAFPALGWKTILLAHVVFNASLVMLIVRARFVGMGSTLEEASFDLGAGPISTFRQVTLPRLFPAVLAGALLAFTFSFDDYVLSNFTAGATTQTWPMVIFAAVRFGVTPAINALATMMLGVTFVLIIATGIVLRRGAKSAGSAEREKGLAGVLGLG